MKLNASTLLLYAKEFFQGMEGYDQLVIYRFEPSQAEDLLNLAYFLLKRSTLPAESTSFCLPVKKG